MATHDDQLVRLTLRADWNSATGTRSGHRDPVGAWWPEDRTLTDQLGKLFASWPPEAGRISRVLFSSPDWDDRPRSVAVTAENGMTRRVKTGSFPNDDTNQLTLSMATGERLVIDVIPPSTSPEDAQAVLQGFATPKPSSPAAP